MALGIKTSVSKQLSVQNVDLAANSVESSIVASIKTGTVTISQPLIVAYGIADTIVPITGIVATDTVVISLVSTLLASQLLGGIPLCVKTSAGSITVTMGNGFPTTSGIVATAVAGIYQYIRVNTLK